MRQNAFFNIFFFTTLILSFIFGVKTEGKIYGIGNNENSILTGNGEGSPLSYQRTDLEDIVSVAAESETSFVVNKQGRVYSLGQNIAISDRPALIPELFDVAKVISKKGHTIVIKKNSEIYGWGYNAFGELGIGTRASTQITPKKCMVENITQVTVGDRYTLALNSSGFVYGFGDSSYGRLGLGGNGKVHPIPILIPLLKDIIQISSSAYHSLVLDKNGRVFGSPVYIPTMLDVENVTSVATGVFTSFIKIKGDFFGFGYNRYQQLGTKKSQLYINEPTKLVVENITQIYASDYTFALNDKREIYIFGLDTYGVAGNESKGVIFNVPTKILNNCDEVDAGFFHSLVVKQGRLYSAGKNEYNQLGRYLLTPTFLGEFLSMSVGFDHSLALQPSGEVFSVGKNNFGQCGHGEIVSISKHTKILNFSSVAQISAGKQYSLILLKNGSVFSFGYTEYGRMGTGTTVFMFKTPTLISSIQNITQIKAGHSHSLALNHLGEVFSFGRNYHGQLGIGNTANQYSPVKILNLEKPIIKISVGGVFSMILDNEGKLFGFGSNYNYEIRAVGTTVYPTPVEILGLMNIVDFSAGFSHTIALNSSGTVFGFGRNLEGQIDSSSDARIKVQEIAYFNSKSIKSIGVGDFSTSVLDKDGMAYNLGRISILNEETGFKNTPAQLNVSGTNQVISTINEAILFSEQQSLTSFCLSYNESNTIVCNQKETVSSSCKCKDPKFYIRNCLNLTEMDQEKYLESKICVDFINPSEIISSEINVPLNQILNTTITILDFSSTGLQVNHEQGIKCFLNTVVVLTVQISQNQYLCQLGRLSAGKYNVSLYYVNSNALNSKVAIAKYPIEISVQTPIWMKQISPHATTFLSTNNYYLVNLDLEEGLLSKSNMFCKYHSKGENVTYSIVNNISGSQVECSIQKMNFQGLHSAVDVGLTIKYSSIHYDISNNNLTIYFLKPIQWSHSILDSNIHSNELLFRFLPTKNFNYSLNLMYDNEVNVKQVLNCSFSDRNNSICYFNDMNPTYNPSLFHFDLNVTIHESGKSNLIQVNDFVFHREMEIVHLKPYLFKPSERLGEPFRIISNVAYSLRNDIFAFFCRVTQNETSIKISAMFDVKSGEYEANLDKNSHFSCTIDSVVSSNYTVQLYFTHEGKEILLTPNSASIYSLSNSLSIEKKLDSNEGGFSVGPVDIPRILPTKNYDNYTFLLKISDRDQYYSLGPCNFSNSSLSCVQRNFSQNYLVWNNVVKKFKFELFVGTIRFLSVFPFSHFYNLKILDIIPTSTLLTNSQYQLTFYLVQRINTFEVINVEYLNHLSEIQTKNCKQKNSNTIECPSPTYSFETTAQIFLSLSGGKYINTFKNISFISSDMVFRKVDPKYIYDPYQKSIMIHGENFLNSSIKVKFSNKYFIYESQAKYVDNEMIIADFPNFHGSNIKFPLKMELDFSFDAGVNFMKSNLTVTLDNLKKILFFPNKLEEKTPIKIQMKNFPQMMKNLDIQLVSKNHVIQLMCNTNFTSCNSTSQLSEVGEYVLNAFWSVNNVKSKLYVESEIFSIYYSPNFTQTYPPLVFYTMNSHFLIEGSGFSIHKTNSIVRFEKTTSIFEGSKDVIDYVAVVKNDSIIKIFVESIPEDYSFISIQISFDSGFNFKEFKRLALTKTPVLEVIENLDSPLHRDGTAYSFQDCTLNLHGKNFYDTNIIVRVKNSGFTKFFHNSVNFTNTQMVKFQFPSFERIGIGYNLSYPTNLQFGLSFNGGYSFTESNLIYIDKFVFIIIYLVNPTLVQKTNSTLSVRGLGLRYANKCLFMNEKLDIILETNATLTGEDRRIFCSLEKNITLNQKTLFLKVSNIFNDSSNSVKIDLYKLPEIQKLSSNSGFASGGYSVGITGKFDDFPLYCKFGTIPCLDLCERKNSSYAICNVTPYRTGTYPFSLGHDRVFWSNNPLVNFTFVPCGKGHESLNFSAPCTKCPIGKFKPTIGDYQCLPCFRNTFMDELNATNCKFCPKNSISEFGSESIKNCHCNVGYFTNPSNESPRCLSCPTGAICNKINSSTPLSSKFGYWKANLHDINFYACRPEFACGGGSAGNCTAGYVGVLCGNCDKGYYRSKSIYCIRCGNVFFNYFKLICAAMFLLLGTLVISLVSKYYPSLLISTSILLTYWQVLSIISKYDIKWPWVVDVTMQTAGASSLSFDFLQLECLFPFLDFTTIWIFKVLIPLILMMSFVLFYLFGVLRSIFAYKLGNLWMKRMNIRYITPPGYSSDEKMNKIIWIKRQFIWLYNLIIWIPRQGSTRKELAQLFHRMLNSLSAYVSFIYIFIMTTASEIFDCYRQPNGLYTLQSSPNLFCFQGGWFALVPLSLFLYVLFGFGVCIYFAIMIIQRYKDPYNEQKQFPETPD
eukprot:gene12581-6401_t